MADPGAPLLEISGLVAGYRDATVLGGLDLQLRTGESIALLGRNGSGKTTLIASIMGLTRRFSGTIRFRGKDISALPPEARAAAGLGWVPQERNIFRSLSVEENLTAVQRGTRWSLPAIYALFPRLKERRGNLGGALSGGEQQMLALGRALMLSPGLLLLDEPLEGLAPIIVEELLGTIAALIREEGMGVILVEQKARKILPITTHALILDRGNIVYANRATALLQDEASLSRHLSVSNGPAAARK